MKTLLLNLRREAEVVKEIEGEGSLSCRSETPAQREIKKLSLTIKKRWM
jgi:hypothetical protein